MRRTLTVIMWRTISSTSETTLKTCGRVVQRLALAVSTATNVGVVPSIPRRTNQQRHCVNVPAQTPSDYYKRAVAIPLLDHLQSEMKTYFNLTDDAVFSGLFNLLPELGAVGDRNPNTEAVLEFYENDLPSPHVVFVELLRWKRK